MARVPKKWVRDNYSDEQIIAAAPKTEQREKRLELYGNETLVNIGKELGAPLEEVEISIERDYSYTEVYAVYKYEAQLTDAERLKKGAEILRLREQKRQDTVLARERKYKEYQRLKKEFEEASRG